MGRLWDFDRCGRSTGRPISRLFQRSPHQPLVPSGAPRAFRTSRPAIRVDWSWAAILLIAILSGFGAFALVRSLVAPPRAATGLPATLTVGTQPAGADLIIDGRRRGQTPLTLAIEPGAHTLTLRSAGAERTVPLTVTAGAQVTQYFELTPPGPVTPSARLSIVTDPAGARVSVDGRPRGVSPLVIEDLAAAEHSVTVTSNTGSAERRITIEPGTTKEVVFSLPRSSAPLGGWVSVASPFHVDLIEHDEVVGTSGTTKVMLPAGRHDVVLRNESVGYEARHSVDVVAGSVATIEVGAAESVAQRQRPAMGGRRDRRRPGRSDAARQCDAPGRHARDHLPASTTRRTHADGCGHGQGCEPRRRRFDQVKGPAKCR